MSHSTSEERSAMKLNNWGNTTHKKVGESLIMLLEVGKERRRQAAESSKSSEKWVQSTENI